MPRRKSAYRAALATVPDLLRGPTNPVVIPDGMPATVEVGMGAGHFLVACAARDPGRMFVGVEIKEERAFQASREARQMGVTNVMFIVGELTRIKDALPRARFDQLFVLFPDPWPRKRDFARRLTSVRYLSIIRTWLAPGARCEFRSDNAALFCDALGTIREAGFTITSSSNNTEPDVVQTRYEKRFRAESKPIHGIHFRWPG